MSSLGERVAFITGASSGVSHATALRPAQEGMRVGLLAPRIEALHLVAERSRRNKYLLPEDVAESIVHVLRQPLRAWI